MSEQDESSADAPVTGEIAVEVEGPTDPLAEKLAAAEKAKQENWDKYLRAVADLENFRRRSKREVDDAKSDTKIRVLKEILPVIDNLERALTHVPDADETPVAAGVRLVLRQFLQSCERLDVHQVDAAGKPFDPNVHEAISQEASEQAVGTIVSVLQKGYRVGDRLLRPAMVTVAKPRDEAPTQAQATPSISEAALPVTAQAAPPVADEAKAE